MFEYLFLCFRNYLSSLINKPLEYEKASKLQKQVYQSMYHWLNHKSKRTVPFTETARPALQTLNISIVSLRNI